MSEKESKKYKVISGIDLKIDVKGKEQLKELQRVVHQLKRDSVPVGPDWDALRKKYSVREHFQVVDPFNATVNRVQAAGVKRPRVPDFSFSILADICKELERAKSATLLTAEDHKRVEDRLWEKYKEEIKQIHDALDEPLTEAEVRCIVREEHARIAEEQKTEQED